ncbi:MAG: hypothetical protein WC477_05915 [Patescibacteria group bacterium]
MISEKYKFDTALRPQSISSTGSTGEYFNLAKWGKAVFKWNVSMTGLTASSTGLIYQATDAAATDAAAITSTSTVAYGTSNATVASIVPAVTISAADTVTVNGLTFTAVSATATAASREFVDNTANISTTITNLAAIINNAQYGVPGILATAGSAVLTLTFEQPGESPANRNLSTYEGIVLTSSSTTNLTCANIQIGGLIEIDATRLTASSNFTHVALNVINTAAYYTAATIVRGDEARYSPYQTEPVTRV